VLVTGISRQILHLPVFQGKVYWLTVFQTLRSPSFILLSSYFFVARGGAGGVIYNRIRQKSRLGEIIPYLLTLGGQNTGLRLAQGQNTYPWGTEYRTKIDQGLNTKCYICIILMNEHFHDPSFISINKYY